MVEEGSKAVLGGGGMVEAWRGREMWGMLQRLVSVAVSVRN
jgi:hypothetical protein